MLVCAYVTVQRYNSTCHNMHYTYIHTHCTFFTNIHCFLNVSFLFLALLLFTSVYLLFLTACSAVNCTVKFTPNTCLIPILNCIKMTWDGGCVKLVDSNRDQSMEVKALRILSSSTNVKWTITCISLLFLYPVNRFQSSSTDLTQSVEQ